MPPNHHSNHRPPAPQRGRHIAGKVALALLSLVVAWYTAVLLMGPKPSVRDPALPMVVHMRLAQHWGLVRSGDTAFDDLQSNHLRDAIRSSTNEYRLELRVPETGKPRVLIAIPRRYEVCQLSVPYRLALLDFTTCRYRSFFLTEDGTLCWDSISGFDESNPPTFEDVQRIAEHTAGNLTCEPYMPGPTTTNAPATSRNR